MSILLKQSNFSAFTRPEPMFRVLPQQSYGTLVWRGYWVYIWVTQNFFGKPTWYEL